MKRTRRDAGGMQDAHRLGGNQRGLLCGLRHYAVAGGERACDLAEENRERKVPRADADEGAAAAVAELVAFAGWAGQRLRGEPAARLEPVVATEIDRLAHLAHRIIERLAAFGLQQRDQPAAPLLQEIARAFERGGARVDGRLRPAGEA